MFSFKNKEIKQLFQWDKDIVLVFDSKYINQEVHFSNNKKNALVKDIDENGEVSIPNSLLTENKPIEVYLFLDDNYTKERRILKIIPRPKPDDYVYTEEEIKKYEDLEKRLNNILVMQNKAQIGQIIKVAAIDEDGKPTAWEAFWISELEASEIEALETLAEHGVITPAHQNEVFYTDASGAIYVL